MRKIGKTPPIVEVDWEDSETSHNWRDRSEDRYEIAPCRSAGYLVESSRRYVRLTESIDDNGNTGCTTSIPRFAVRRMRVIRRGK